MYQTFQVFTVLMSLLSSQNVDSHDVCATFLLMSALRIYHYKVTEPLHALSLVDRCVYMRICKHGCDVLDSRIFLRIILHV